jgi:outer membrane usher protein FimD/PapC
MSDGSPVPNGASVIDARKKLLTLVAEEGEIFLTNDPAGERLGVHLPDGAQCILEFALPAAPDPDAHYETVDATCRPGRITKNELAMGQAGGAP